MYLEWENSSFVSNQGLFVTGSGGWRQKVEAWNCGIKINWKLKNKTNTAAACWARGGTAVPALLADTVSAAADQEDGNQ